MASGYKGFSVWTITREGSENLDDPAPFNPKRVTYEAIGSRGAVATINHL